MCVYCCDQVRMKKETLRLETKQTRQMAELRAKNEAIIKELDEVYLEKQAALLESERQKMEDLETKHRHAMERFTQSIEPRQQGMEEEFALEFEKFEQFYSSGSTDAICPPYPMTSTFSVRSSMAL